MRAAPRVDPATLTAWTTDGGGGAFCDGCGGSLMYSWRVTDTEGRHWNFCSTCCAKVGA